MSATPRTHIDRSLDPDAPGALPPSRKAPRSAGSAALIGAAAGCVVTAFAAVLVAPRVIAHPPAAAAPAFSVDKGSVHLVKGAVPMKFETAQVSMGAPLSRNPVTARVATIESRTAPSFAPLAGRVAKVEVRIGDRVKEGDKLLLVRSGELSGMQRDLRAAQLSIRTKQALADRLKMLVEGRAASQNDLMVAQSELAEASLTASAAGARLRSLNVKQESDNAYWVLATRSGIVVQLEAVAGQEVGPDKDRPVATVADLDEVLVVGDVTQKEAATLVVGTTVTITEPGAVGPPHEGRIEVVSDVLDQERQTVPIRIRVKNDQHRLRPHEYVEAAFAPSSAARMAMVPTESVVSDGAQSVVFVETEPGVLRRRQVQVGRQNREQTEILTGLAPGESVVVRGALLLLNAVDVRG